MKSDDNWTLYYVFSIRYNNFPVTYPLWVILYYKAKYYILIIYCIKICL